MSEPFIGQISLFAGNFQPVSYMFCDGRLLSIAQYSALYALIGTTYGGDGVNTFALPGLQGRVPIGQGQGPGLSPRTIGEVTGSETVTLTTGQIPAHTHTLVATTVPGTATTPSNNLLAKPNDPSGTVGFLYLSPTAPSPVTDAPIAPMSISAAGGSQQHENRMPLLAINYIIAVEGVFPSFN